MRKVEVLKYIVRHSPSQHFTYSILNWYRPRVTHGLTWINCDVDGLNFRLKVDLAEVYGYWMYMLGQIEPVVSFIVRRLFHSNGVMLDIGANVGYYSILAAYACPNGQVWSFEPSPRTYGILCENIQANRLQNVVARQLALGETHSMLKFNIYGDQALNSVSVSAEHRHPFFPGGPVQVLNVECTTIDDVMNDNHIERVDLIKLDIEGYEYFALKGAERLLARPDAPILVCEIEPLWLKQFELSASGVIRYVQSLGYRCFEVTSYGLVERERISDNPQSGDYIFAKRVDQINELRVIGQKYYSGFRQLKGKVKWILLPAWRWIRSRR
jgi:FkbM family methyltransferase